MKLKDVYFPILFVFIIVSMAGLMLLTNHFHNYSNPETFEICQSHGFNFTSKWFHKANIVSYNYIDYAECYEPCFWCKDRPEKMLYPMVR